MEKQIHKYKAFKDFYDAGHGKLYNFVFRLTGDKEVAKDIVQNSYIEVWTRFENISSDQTAQESYIFTVAKRMVKRYFILKVKELEAIGNYGYVQSLESNTKNEVELFERVHKNLVELPQRQQQVIRLAKIEGKSIKQISQELSISQSTVEKHIIRAVRNLKKNLTTISNLFF